VAQSPVEFSTQIWHFFIHRFGPSPAPCNWPRPVEDCLDMVPRSNMSRLHSFAPPARLRREGIQCGFIQGCGFSGRANRIRGIFEIKTLIP
jgi:hypothetical protein